MSQRHKIIIAGAGGMGSAVALLLRELGDSAADVSRGDASLVRARRAAAWVREGSSRPGAVEASPLPAQGSSPELERLLAAGDLLLDCLPGSEAPRLARLARKH